MAVSMPMSMDEHEHEQVGIHQDLRPQLTFSWGIGDQLLFSNGLSLLFRQM